MGVLMANHKITRQEAFDLLRIASQRSNRKLRHIATQVADTGTLDLPKQ
jgi:AmiR/NasT family two-component response regulator